MAAELGLLSLNQLQKLAESQQSQLSGPPTKLSAAASTSTWMWNPKAPEDDDSWEVRAFAEDTGNIMGTTWPPRSYTCTFCRREFRSAQALGGHMNVHRRDRARLHQTQPPSSSSSINPTSPSSATTSSSALLIPTQEFVANGGGLCLLYQLPNPNGGVFAAASQPPINACSIDSPSTLLSISPYPPSNNLMAAPPISFPATPPPPGLNMNHSAPSSLCCSSRAEVAVPCSRTTSAEENNDNCKETSMEELDLELRLGHRPSTS